MAAARIVMGDWGEKWRNIIEKAGVKLPQLDGYVDDVRHRSTCLRFGMRWSQDEEQFVWSQEAKDEDKMMKYEQQESTNARMARLCLPAINSVNKDLVFTAEIPEEFKDKKLPTLDFFLWLEKNGILNWSYFQKSMKTPFVIMEPSAMGEQQRHQILANELIRRLSNTNIDKPDVEERTTIIETYTQQLKSSGYSRKQSREIVVSGVVGWKRKVKRRETDGLDFYRSAKSTLAGRCRKKLLEKETWFKAKRKREDDEEENPREQTSPRKRTRIELKGMDKNKQTDKADSKKEQAQESVKTVMFVPYTVGSSLAKKMREAESSLQQMTGYRLKIVERAGQKLEDVLTKANPWQGQDCEREKCLLCATKQRTGKLLTQDCKRRNIVYETWCITCHDRDMQEAEEQAGGDQKEQKRLEDKIKKYKYVGESARSCYERGWEHQADLENLSTKSHMLKHAVEKHTGEEINNLKFGMKILRSAKRPMDRQIWESVLIQEGRKHYLLNSRSEFNRCAVPRLTCKLGDKEFKKYEKEMTSELAKEEEQIGKIRQLVKARNRDRNTTKGPANKRRKLDETTYTSTKTSTDYPRVEAEKRKQEESQGQAAKRSRTQDIREAFQPKDTNNEAAPNTTKEQTQAVHYGELEEVELIDWEEKFKAHQEETARINKERENRIEQKEKQEKSWELLRECVKYIKEHGKEWKKEEEERLTERQKKEKKNQMKQQEQKRAEQLARDATQRKITETWNLLPEHEKRNLVKMEEKRKLLELRDIKVNIWKKWRKETEEKKAETERENKSNQEKWLEKIEDTLTRMRKEVEDKKKAKAIYEERRKKLIEEKKHKQEEILRREQEKKERKQKQRMLKERWAMTRWLTSYIDENSTRWKAEKDQRQLNEIEKAESWKKMNRLEKVRILKEKASVETAAKNLKVVIKPASLLPNDDIPQEQDQHDDHQQQHVLAYDDHTPEQTDDQLPGNLPDQDDHQPMEAGQMDVKPDVQDDQADQSDNNLQILQPLTKPRVSCRCVEFPNNTIHVPSLTSHMLGTEIDMQSPLSYQRTRLR